MQKRSESARMAFLQSFLLHPFHPLRFNLSMQLPQILCVHLVVFLHLHLHGRQQGLQLANPSAHELILINGFDERRP